MPVVQDDACRRIRDVAMNGEPNAFIVRENSITHPGAAPKRRVCRSACGSVIVPAPGQKQPDSSALFCSIW
jgi:hypothetical protein